MLGMKKLAAPLALVGLGGAAMFGTNALVGSSAIVAAPPPTEPGVSRIGPRLTGEANDSPAVARALAALPQGGRLVFPCARAYDLAARIDVCVPVSIEGCDAGREDFARTKLRFAPTATIGVAFRFAPWCRLAGKPGPGSNGSTLRGMQLVEARAPAKPVSRIGVLVEAPMVTLQRVDVSGFGNGVVVSAGIKRGTGRNRYCESDAQCLAGQVCERKLCRSGLATSANSTALLDVRVRLSDHAGVLARGPDANAGSFDLVSAINTCRRATEIHAAESAAPGALAWPWSVEPVLGDDGKPKMVDGAVVTQKVSALEPCAGVVDNSFLGNTWTAPHVAGCGARLKEWPAYRALGANNRAVFVGAYAEEDCALSAPAANALVLGGKSHWGGGGAVISGRSARGLTFAGATFRSSPSLTPGLHDVLRVEVDGTDQWWIFQHDARETSPHRGWTRLMWKGGSSSEVTAIKSGSRR